MTDEFSWLITMLGVISLVKGLENIYPKMARHRLKRTLEQPDHYFRAIGIMFIALGAAIIYIGLN